jgi:hypothetical protein
VLRKLEHKLFCVTKLVQITLSPYSLVLSENLLKIFHVFYDTRGSIAVLKRALHWSPP